MIILSKRQSRSRRLFPPAFSMLAVLVLHTPPATAVERTGAASPPKSALGNGLVFTTATTPAPLIQCLLGGVFQLRNETLTAADGAAGTFTGGTAILGFEQGLALGTGLIADAVGPNLGTQIGTDHESSGDADLDGLIDPETTFDATILEFEFFTAQPRTIEFQYVFASEEYSEFVGAGFDDVVAFFLNGVAAVNNIARVPLGCGTVAGIPVSVDNVNCGNASDPKVTPTNCNCYIDNEQLAFPPSPTPINTEMDGLTQVFTATGSTVAGWNRLKIAVADAGDAILDSNVFIRCQSFIVPVHPESWGGIKSRYR